MARNNHRIESPESALHQTADALGGLQEAGVFLRPEYRDDPDKAGRWLSHCLDDDKRDKLSLRQTVRLFRRAFELDDHDGFKTFSRLCGYEASPVPELAHLAHLRKKAEDAAREAERTANDLHLLLKNPELLARMEAAGLRVGEL